jgi:Sulfotransferase domain
LLDHKLLEFEGGLPMLHIFLDAFSGKRGATMSEGRPTVEWPDNTVWLASYPRSGNTYLRSILWTCFGLPTGSVYPDDLRGDLAVSQQVGHFEAAAHGQFSADFLRLPLVKTHERPFDDQKAIYIVRNGRDCCRSLLEFYRADGQRDVNLDDIIVGQHYFGSWSGHFRAWDPEARPNTLFLRFEELTQDFDGTLERLGKFLEMRPLHTVPPKLVPARGVGPHWLSPGSRPGRAMTSAQEALFDRLHGDVMGRLGYPTAPSQTNARAEISSFPLFTSIKPPTGERELSYLRKCLISWRAAGFNPISINGPAETEQLRGFDLPVAFHATAADGEPRIGAILDAIRASEARLAGIINSDCKIVNYPGLVANLKAQMDGAVVLARRVDLGLDFRPTTQHGGFDAFFFDTKVIPRDDCGFSIAEPWWDHWFPLACEMSGARLETLAVPLLTHIAHPAQRGDQTFIRAGRRFWGALQNWHSRGDMPESLLSKIPADLPFNSVPSWEQLSRLAVTTTAWLNEYRPQTISIMGPQASDVEMMLRFYGRAIAETETRLQSEIAILQAEISSFRAEISSLRNSRSWRLTAPLRWMVISVRAIAAAARTRIKERRILRGKGLGILIPCPSGTKPRRRIATNRKIVDSNITSRWMVD